MKHLSLLPPMLLLLASPGSASPPPLREPAPVYHLQMTAEVDPASGLISGSQHLRWHNTTSHEVKELRFHLYLNAFANNRSSFMQGSNGQLRGLSMPEGAWGWTKVSSIVVRDPEAGAADPDPAQGEPTASDRPFARLQAELSNQPTGHELKASEQFLAPDDGNPDDRTVASYQLPQPLAPGAWIELDIEFTSQLPGVFCRTGKHQDYLLGGQWFPKIGVLEEQGWACHQLHADGEFFADFGSYDVTLVLPARYQGKIGATGQLADQWLEEEQVHARFTQAGVHDFAWVADPNLVLIKDRFDPERDVPREQRSRIAATLGVGPEQLSLRPVELLLLIQPANRSQAGRYLAAAKAALRGYGLRLGAYPYPTLTLVDPPRGAIGSAGMEYPTFVTLGTHPLLGIPPWSTLPMPEEVTIHEVGHQFFQGMIASNETEESWIDEGFNTYYDALVMKELLPELPQPLLGMFADPIEMDRRSLVGDAFDDAIVTPAWRFASSRSYAVSSYWRPALTLHHLERLLGPEVFHPAMRTVFQTWRWRHPTTDDLLQTLAEAAGQDLDWFFDQALRTTHHLDYAVAAARSERIEPLQGAMVADDADRQDGSEEPSEPGESEEVTADNGYRSTVRIKRLGELHHPVVVELCFTDGHCQRLHWDGEARWHRFEVTRDAGLASVEIDPGQRMLLDVNRINNSRRLQPDPSPRHKLMSFLLFALQNLCEAAALVG